LNERFDEIVKLLFDISSSDRLTLLCNKKRKPLFLDQMICDYNREQYTPEKELSKL